MLATGRILALIMFAVVLVAILVTWQRAKKGKVPKLRSLPPIEVIDEAIARAAELEAPVHITTGYGGGGLSSPFGIYHLSGLTIMSKVARETAKYNIRLIGTFCHAELVPIAEDIVRQAYLAEGNPQGVKPEMAQFVAGSQFAYAMGVMGILMRDKPAVNLMVGNYWAESLVIAESGNIVGALQIAGAGELTAVPLLIAACDYVLIGEEVFAASAKITGDPIAIGNILSEDITKFIGIAIMLVGVLLTAVGMNLAWLTKF
jgi:hypothetical protein